MTELLLIAAAAFCASMVDGALGMGFGPTSATILLSSGISPATTSTIVNLAKVAVGFAAAVSHWRFDNINRRLVIQLAGPGVIGAIAGTTVLANVDGDDLRPFLALMLMAVGVRLLIRFSRHLPAPGSGPTTDTHGSEDRVPGAELAGAAAGVTNGLVGAWGPVVTPFLLQRGVAPRYAVGSVNTAEVAVAVVSAGSLLASLGGAGVEITMVAAMLAGGVLAAPLAAYLVRFLPARLLGVAVAGLLLTTQAHELAKADLLPSGVTPQVVVIIACGWAALRPRWATRVSGAPTHQGRRPAPEPHPATHPGQRRR